MSLSQIFYRHLFGLFLIAAFLVCASSGVSARSLDFSSSSVSFGNIPVGSAQTQYETFTNNYQTSTVTISGATVSGIGFSFSGLSLPVTLSPGQSVTFTIAFTPKASGALAGQIVVASNAWSVPTHTVTLSGTGVSGGKLTTSASTLNFGSVAVGSSKTLSASLSATGSSVTISSATVTNSVFTLTGLALPKTLSTGQTISVTLTFTPRASGTASGTISLASTATNTPVVETVTGSGTGGAQQQHSVDLTWSPSTSSVVGYNVYRSGSSGGPYSRLTSVPVAGTSYLDSSVKSGQTYYYVDTSIDSRGIESIYSGQFRAVIPTP